MNFLFKSGVALAALLIATNAAWAREAAFMNPNTTSTSKGLTAADAVTVEPKTDNELGDSVVNVSRRLALFFSNQTSMPVEVENMSLTSDSNVNGSIVTDDCSKEGKISPNSRCSVVLSLTPTSGGPWSAELLMTHKGSGRIARAKISGKATGDNPNDRNKDTGLTLSTKEVQPVNFGEVELGASKAVKSTLVVNDSAEPITILSIDLIAADNGLAKMEQGCSVDMDLKPGESCPITLSWQPTAKGTIFTDLIVRHSGKMGFVVVPVRGNAKDTSATATGSKGNVSGSSQTSSASSSSSPSGKSGDGKPPMPPTAEDLEKAVSGKLPALSEDALGVDIKPSRKATKISSGVFRLIGTVGNKAVLLKPDGSTTVSGIGQDISYDGDRIAKITNITPKSAEIFVDGKKKELMLESVDDLTDNAVINHHKSTTEGTKK
jgi:hypothetical protein